MKLGGGGKLVLVEAMLAGYGVCGRVFVVVMNPPATRRVLSEGIVERMEWKASIRHEEIVTQRIE